VKAWVRVRVRVRVRVSVRVRVRVGVGVRVRVSSNRQRLESGVASCGVKASTTMKSGTSSPPG
jgi:hypothetical protein